MGRFQKERSILGQARLSVENCLKIGLPTWGFGPLGGNLLAEWSINGESSQPRDLDPRAVSGGCGGGPDRANL